MSIETNLQSVIDEIDGKVKLIAVSKMQPLTSIMEAYKYGQRAFGENKVQEMITKYEQLPKDIEWHLLGHLQTNKVKYIAPFASLIHSVDSFNLLQVIDSEAKKNNRSIQCLLQIKIAREESKFGFTENEVFDMVCNQPFQSLQNVSVIGLMGIATYSDDEDLIYQEFSHIQKLFTTLKEDYFRNDPAFSELSIGMSGDYKIAIRSGSTMIRIGSLIFGQRVNK
jgi:pyridoxal phosphate enzyme (YggS family)